MDALVAVSLIISTAPWHVLSLFVILLEFVGIFERFRGILHEGEIDKRVQFLIEGLFAIRKAKFQVWSHTLGDDFFAFK